MIEKIRWHCPMCLSSFDVNREDVLRDWEKEIYCECIYCGLSFTVKYEDEKIATYIGEHKVSALDQAAISRHVADIKSGDTACFV